MQPTDIYSYTHTHIHTSSNPHPNQFIFRLKKWVFNGKFKNNMCLFLRLTLLPLKAFHSFQIDRFSMNKNNKNEKKYELRTYEKLIMLCLKKKIMIFFDTIFLLLRKIKCSSHANKIKLEKLISYFINFIASFFLGIFIYVLCSKLCFLFKDG